MERIVMGILAHVDAGKTTLAEAMLYHSGRIRERGRVDHGDAYLDTDAMEKERGITIFSKQAVFLLGEKEFTLLDTPGHVDFSAEMERTLSVLDIAVLLVSAGDGIQGHTETLWKLLKKHGIPTLIFVNKMDQPGAEPERLLKLIQKKFSENCLDFRSFRSDEVEPVNENKPRGEMDGGEFSDNFSVSPALMEMIAMSEESAMESFLEKGKLSNEEVRELFRRRAYFPVFFGSALKDTGIGDFLSGLSALTEERKAKETLSGRVYKIGKGENGQRLSYLRLTGGVLHNREELREGEKVTQIRIYSGARFEAAEQAFPGQVVAVQGISSLKAGDVFGEEEPSQENSLRPVLDYQVLPDIGESTDELKLYRTLSELSDEFPELHLSFDTELKEIHVHLMGEVQTEILKRIVEERYGLKICFSSGNILYMETILESVEGVGHFEPLRHYAEVHLLLEPLPRNSGLEFRADCSLEMLSQNWQRLVLKHLMEREHRGVLTGSPITDMRLTLIAGKAHQKHSEGGDFREATYRAVRQGLRKAVNQLLEPYYSFSLEVPAEFVGRAMTDISNMHGSFESPEQDGESAFLTGTAPVSAMRDYAKELMIYSKGRGKLYLEFYGYESCHNAEEVVFAAHYDPEADLANPSSSVFCAHGSGFIVPFDQVENYAQVISPYAEKNALARRTMNFRDAVENAEKPKEKSEYTEAGYYIGDKELENIFTRTYGSIKNRAAEVSASDARTVRAREREENIRRAQEERRLKTYKSQSGKNQRKNYLLVDGYNIIFAWEELSALAERNLDAARGKLLDILSNYQGYMGMELIVVFDAYRVQGHAVEQTKFHNIYVVYTREAQTADQYIEELSRALSMAERGNVSIATSDKVVQIIVWSGENVSILSAGDLEKEVRRVEEEIRREHLSVQSTPRERMGNSLEIPEEIRRKIQE